MHKPNKVFWRHVDISGMEEFIFFNLLDCFSFLILLLKFLVCKGCQSILIHSWCCATGVYSIHGRQCLVVFSFSTEKILHVIENTLQFCHCRVMAWRNRARTVSQLPRVIASQSVIFKVQRFVLTFSGSTVKQVWNKSPCSHLRSVGLNGNIYCLLFLCRTYFDNIVAIDSLLEHIMVSCLFHF